MSLQVGDKIPDVTLKLMTADGIDFVNKYDTGRLLLCLVKHIANTRGTDTYEHFDKVRTRYGEERNFGLTGYGFC